MKYKYARDYIISINCIPFRTKSWKIIEDLNLDFYLTGGTALGRCYLNHRYSDDLDFFVNDNDNFKTECNAAINALKDRWTCDIAATSGTFARIFLKTGDITLKVDFVNDVPDHYGEIKRFPLFHRIDSWQNILSNKLCALSRLEVKDIVDIVFIAKNYSFDWETIVGEARCERSVDRSHRNLQNHRPIPYRTIGDHKMDNRRQISRNFMNN